MAYVWNIDIVTILNKYIYLSLFFSREPFAAFAATFVLVPLLVVAVLVQSGVHSPFDTLILNQTLQFTTEPAN